MPKCCAHRFCKHEQELALDDAQTFDCDKRTFACHKDDCCVRDEDIDSLTCLRCVDKATSVPATLGSSSAARPAISTSGTYVVLSSKVSVHSL
jgi:hypothetical protein